MKGFAAILFTLLLFPLFAVSQVSITTAGPAGSYTQGFNTAFLGTGNYSLTDNAPANLGWYAFRNVGNATPNIFFADTGASGTEQFKNYGSTGSADRAMGSLAEAGTGTLLYGLRLQNDTGVLIRSIRIQYTGEQWRRTNNNSIQTLSFSYQVSAGDITSLTTGAYTNFAGLDFASPQVGAPATALDGNLAANRTAKDQAIFVDIPIGGEIMLRWTDPDDGGNDHGLSIDDLTVTFFVPSAAGVSVAGRAVTEGGIGIGNAVVTLSGGTLTEPMTARTSSFGYFSFEGVPSGATYLVEISSKRYQFANPSRTISVEESIADLDFLASGK